jgi:hypothetical protein
MKERGLMRHYQADEVCRLVKDEARPSMPIWANLKGGRIRGIMKKHPELQGAGVYACFWDGKLIYIGSYVGPEANPFAGSVVDRIYKHAIGLTVRAKDLFFGQKAFKDILGQLDKSPIGQDLAQADPSACVEGSIMSTYRKAVFASAQWAELCDMEPSELLRRFSFTYARLDPALYAGVSKKRLKQQIAEGVEKSLIRHFRPACNSAYNIAGASVEADFDDVSAKFRELLAEACGAEVTAMDLTDDSAETNIDLDDTGAPYEEVPDDIVDEVESEEELNDMAWPVSPDGRWVIYTTEKTKQLRAKSRTGRVVAVRASSLTVHCLASVSALEAKGIEASPLTFDTPLKSQVKIGDWLSEETKANLKMLLELSCEAAEQIAAD